MRARATGGKFLVLCTLILAGAVGSHAAAASPREARHPFYSRGRHEAHHRPSYIATAWRKRHRHTRFISCVPFARAESGIEISGNAWEWWENAAGRYARGDVPRTGSVIVFQSNRRMPLGHVAVVTRIVDSRQIEVDQANWPHGGIERGVAVVDVSARNDWTAVRVQIGRGDDYGSIYPTYGFIYAVAGESPDVAAGRTVRPIPVLNPAPADLRELPVDEELAEAPEDQPPVHRILRRVTHRPHARRRAAPHRG